MPTKLTMRYNYTFIRMVKIMTIPIYSENLNHLFIKLNSKDCGEVFFAVMNVGAHGQVGHACWCVVVSGEVGYYVH